MSHDVSTGDGFLGGIEEVVVAAGLGLVALAVRALESDRAGKDVAAALHDSLVGGVAVFERLLTKGSNLAVVPKRQARIVGRSLTIAGDPAVVPADVAHHTGGGRGNRAGASGRGQVSRDIRREYATAGIDRSGVRESGGTDDAPFNGDALGVPEKRTAPKVWAMPIWPNVAETWALSGLRSGRGRRPVIRRPSRRWSLERARSA